MFEVNTPDTDGTFIRQVPVGAALKASLVKASVIVAGKPDK